MSGFFGCISGQECVGDVFYGTDYHSHLGTKRAGMSFFNGELFVRSIHSIENSYFRNKFEDELGKFKGSRSGIGVISDTESQPITINSHLGVFSVVTIGKIDNIEEITRYLLEHRVNFAEFSGSAVNATELVAVIISRADSFAEGIKNVHELVKGSCSFLILTEKGIYAVRDKFGRTPVVLGRNGHGWVAATESSSFVNLDYEMSHDLGPGEAVYITEKGYEQIIAPGKRSQICSFMWVYYGYPSSYYEGVNVEAARYNCGAALARSDIKEGMPLPDFVAGIPDSGIGHAIGYGNEMRVPYKRPFVKYTPTWPRSFMPQNQDMRALVAKMKLIPNEALTRDSNIVFLDDSIVRGTQLKDNVVKLVEAGVKSVHIRIACPPLIYPCRFLNFSSSRSSLDLFARRIIRDLEGSIDIPDDILCEYSTEGSPRYTRLVEEMRKAIGVSSLRFQKLDDLVKSIGLPKERLCTHCWDNSSYM